MPLASIVMVLLPTGTVQAPLVLVAGGGVSLQATFTRISAMASTAVKACQLTNLPWYCTGALGSDGAALTPFVVPHELKPSGFVGVGGFIDVNCPPGPARMSTHSDCVPRVTWTRLPLQITVKGLSA